MDGLISYCFASRAFTDVVGAILKKCALSGWEFVSSCLAQSLLLIEQSVRDGYALLLDVGYITSNVMLVCGEGLVYLKSFSMGCGNISADLQQVMEISFAQAEELKSKVNLKLEFVRRTITCCREGFRSKRKKQTRWFAQESKK